MFGVFVVFYLFLGGTGAGAVVTCSLADLVLVRQPFGTSAYVQGPSVRPEARIVDFGFVSGFALLVAGIACLLLDLGRIDRVLSLFLNPQPTLLTVGSFALAALAVLAAFLAAVRFLYLPGVRRPVVAVVEAGAVAVAAVVMLYTGLLLQTVGGVAFWATPFVPALFVLSSVSGGAAVVLAGAFFVECDERASWLLGRFVRADVVVIVLEVACAAGFLLWADGSAHPGVQASFARLVQGDAAAAWWLGFVACGLAAPLALEAACLLGAWYARAGVRELERERIGAVLAVVAVLVLVGALCLRWSVTEAGVHREPVLEEAAPVGVLADKDMRYVRETWRPNGRNAAQVPCSSLTRTAASPSGCN